MKLYYSPGASSLGIHVLLEEIGKPYEAETIDVRQQQQYEPAFIKINPKSKVPTFVKDDGAVLTEFPAIATWLARKNPDKHLIPADADGEARVIEVMDYVVSTVHMQGFTRILRPGNFSPKEAEHEAVKTRGHEIVKKAFGILDETLGQNEFVVSGFSIADAAVFYVEFWAVERLKLQLPPNCSRHYSRIKQRPAVLRALKAEGLG